MEIPKIPTLDQNTVISYEEMLQLKADAYNKSSGSLTGYDCELCRNKGYIEKIVDGNEVLAECKCLKVRDTLYLIKKSGLDKQLRHCTFKSFICEEEWQHKVKDTAQNFAKKASGGFFFGGQTGCGKTHICTAIVGALIKKGMSARYFVWREDSMILKALVNDKSYKDIIDGFKKTDVLYIDDLFKQQNVGDADIKLAFEIIDSRYRENRITIISSELTIDDILKIDEALAGRIMQMSRGYQLDVAKDKSRNYRLRR